MVLIWPKLLPNDRPGGMSALAGSRLSPAEALGLCQSRLGTGSSGHTGAGKRGKVGKGGLAGRVGGPRLFFWGPLQSQGAKGLGKNTRAEGECSGKGARAEGLPPKYGKCPQLLPAPKLVLGDRGAVMGARGFPRTRL